MRGSYEAEMQSELKQITNLALFAKVVQIGGISRCAANLGIERTTVSRRIGDLEHALGVKLLTRSPKAVSVTEAGRLCFNQCEQILEIAKSAETAATNGHRIVDADPLFLGAPPDILEHFVGPLIAEFEAENPCADIQCRPVFRPTQDLDSEVDFSISWETLDPSDYFVSSIGAFDQAVYTSLDYIARHGVPQSPDEIHLHTRIAVSGVRKAKAWRFERDGLNQRAPIKPDIEVANILAGLGLCLLPKYFCERHADAGRLVPILPDYNLPVRRLYLITPRRASDKPRATTFRIFLERRLSEISAGNRPAE